MYILGTSYMSEVEFWKHAEPFMKILRQALLQIVRFIEKKYNWKSE